MSAKWSSQTGSPLGAAVTDRTGLSKVLRKLASTVAVEEHIRAKEKRQLAAQKKAELAAIPKRHQKLSDDLVREIRRAFEQQGKSQAFLMARYGEQHKFSRRYLDRLLSYVVRSKVLP